MSKILIEEWEEVLSSSVSLRGSGSCRLEEVLPRVLPTRERDLDLTGWSTSSKMIQSENNSSKRLYHHMFSHSFPAFSIFLNAVNSFFTLEQETVT